MGAEAIEPLNISVVVIGRNVEQTLDRCLKSVALAAGNSAAVSECQILYVDSRSNDASVDIARRNGADVIEIVDGFTSAAFGRYLGMRHARHDDLLFIDGDMDLHPEWFDRAREHYGTHRALIGERFERLWADSRVIRDIPAFYGIASVGEVHRPGGFLMIDRRGIEGCGYHPLIREEEEADFYAQFFHKRKIIAIPYTAYVHNNHNLTASRLRSYARPFGRIGYIVSLFSAVKHGYLKNYLRLQRKYIVSMSASLAVYAAVCFGWPAGLLGGFLLLLNGRKNLKGSGATALLFPYKLVSSIVFIAKRHTAVYVVDGSVHRIDLSL